MPNTKRCPACQQVKNVDQYGYRSNRYDNLSPYCKPCITVKRREWRKKNPEKWAKKKRDWYLRHREERVAYTRNFRLKNPHYKKDYRHRNREKDNAHARDRARSLRNSGFVVLGSDYEKMLRQPCIYCGAKSEHIDHIVPLSRGGRHSIGNLAPACAKCNLTKSRRFITEWKKVRGW